MIVRIALRFEHTTQGTKTLSTNRVTPATNHITILTPEETIYSAKKIATI